MRFRCQLFRYKLHEEVPSQRSVMRLSFWLLFAVNLGGRNCLQLTLIKSLIQNTFNGYDCINVYFSQGCRELCQIDSAAVVRQIQELDFAVLVSSSLRTSNQYCGYVALGNDEESLYSFDGFVFDRNVRVLLLELSDADHSIFTMQVYLPQILYKLFVSKQLIFPRAFFL